MNLRNSPIFLYSPVQLIEYSMMNCKIYYINDFYVNYTRQLAGWTEPEDFPSAFWHEAFAG